MPAPQEGVTQRKNAVNQAKQQEKVSGKFDYQYPRKVGRVPTDPPPFTVGDLRRSIPKHCFQHSLRTSFGYLFHDLALIFGLFFASLHIETLVTEDTFGNYAFLLRHALWLTYWIVQGTVFTGLWVLGHECGHGGFAKSSTVNNVTGWIVHSALLVPYFSWKISHARHHSNTGSLEHDEVFVPLRNDTPRSEDGAKADHDDDSTMAEMLESVTRMANIVVMFLLGWPLYLLLNATGNKSYAEGTWVNHFMPNSPIFQKKQGKLILMSDLGLAIAFSVLGYLGKKYSFGWVLYCYVIPYLMCNFWLVFITFLQHTSVDMPHYNKNEWDWLRGALATVDRDYGYLNGVFHHITDTHVTHHIFHTMPFYHAKEATAHLKMVLGDYYRFDRTPIFKACWENFPLHEVRPDSAENPNVYWFTSEGSK